MRFLNKITAKAHQRFFLKGNPNQNITMTLRYMPTQEAWFMDVQYESFSLYGLRVTYSPNLLRKYRNKLPFGFYCGTNDGQDPFFIDDFSTDRARLYLLSPDDVALMERAFFNGD
jgi:hypothetical protein